MITRSKLARVLAIVVLLWLAVSATSCEGGNVYVGVGVAGPYGAWGPYGGVPYGGGVWVGRPFY